jgi:regulator of protease activity HflC (stomatin/prohibitin superfamily)
VDHAGRINTAIVELDSLRTSVADGQAGTTVQRAIAAKESDIEVLLGEARGEAAEVIHAARGYRWTRAVGEKSASERFTGELLAYERSPDYYRTRRFLDVLSGGLSDRRKFVIAGEQRDLPVLQMDFSDPTSAIDTLLGE